MAKVKHLVVIVAENHSFDNLYGLFPGADGVSNASAEQKIQLDHDGQALKALVVFDRQGKPDPQYPRLPNAPFRIDLPPVSRDFTQRVPPPVHAYWHHQEQINGGKNNRFASVSNVGGWVMGYYDGSSMELWQWAREFTLADRYFMGALGGSYLNHQYLICACAPRFENAPDSMKATLDAQGRLLRKGPVHSANDQALKLEVDGFGGQVSPDGYSLNTSQPPYQPSAIPPAPGGSSTDADPKGKAPYGLPVPAQVAPTIGDRLSEKNISWRWYAGGWNAALADGAKPAEHKREVIYTSAGDSPNFQTHHQPFNYFLKYAPGTAARAEHLRDGAELLSDAAAGRLPAVSFYKPAGRFTQHPTYTDIKSGDAHMASILRALRASPQWPDMLIVVTYDENGGYWDHVAPPTGQGWSDRWGPGSRVPALFIGPQVKRGHVEHTAYDHTSILKFITERWGLQPLPGVRAQMGNLSEVLQ